MQISKREKNILFLASLVAVVFVVSSVFPAISRIYGERNEIIAREVEAEKLSFPDIARASDLYLQIADLSRTLEQLDQLILPEDN